MNLKAKGIITFVSAGDDLSEGVKFYKEIGFTAVHTDEDIAILDLDGYQFILQKYPKEWMKGNFMMILEVEDADAWYQKLSDLKLAERYDEVFLKPPQNYPWGKRACHLGDPNGVLWHISADIR